MSIFDCRSSDAYFQAAEYAHQLSPSVQTAKSLGALYLQQRDDAAKAIEYYEQAVELEENQLAKADIYQTMASIWLSKENYDKSRSCANKAIANNPNKGAGLPIPNGSNGSNAPTISTESASGFKRRSIFKVGIAGGCVAA